MLRIFFTFFILTIFTSPLPAQTTHHDCPILGIGAPCMDILMNVDDQFLHSIGKKGGSQQVEWSFVERIIQQSKIQQSYIATGGSSSNTIKGLCHLGHQCAFFGKIGNDEMGSRYYKAISNLGIVPLCIHSEHPTQVCMCLISTDGDRTIRCYPGAAQESSSQDLTPPLFEKVKLVHIEGYMLYAKDENFVSAAMKLAKEAGAIISFDLSSYDLIKLRKEKIWEILNEYVDIVFANEDEILELTGKDSLEGCCALKEICPIVVVMMGSKGCMVGSGERLHHSPAFPVHAVDTTGAGDLFASGFLHGYLEGFPLEDCARAGNLVGGAVCEVYGAEIPQEKWEELKALISAHP